MSVSKYLNRLPLTVYDDKICRNIRTRVAISDMSLKQYALFHPYTLTNNERADVLSYKYYDESDYAWLVYISNNIVDPYKTWPRTDEQLVEVLVSEYGSVATSQQKILYYRVNWASDDTQIAVSRYTSMPSYERKYWAPVLGNNDTPVGYQRKRIDVTVETNMILYVTVADVAGFSAGDFVTQGSSCAWLAYVGSTYLVLKQVTGSFDLSNITNSSVTTSVSEVVVGKFYNNEHKFATEPIPASEAMYWEPVSAYTAAFEENENKKNIHLIDASHVSAIESELNRLLPQ